MKWSRARRAAFQRRAMAAETAEFDAEKRMAEKNVGIRQAGGEIYG